MTAGQHVDDNRIESVENLIEGRRYYVHVNRSTDTSNLAQSCYAFRDIFVRMELRDKQLFLFWNTYDPVDVRWITSISEAVEK